MSPAEYLDSVKVRLLTDSIVAGFQIRRERHYRNRWTSTRARVDS